MNLNRFLRVLISLWFRNLAHPEGLVGYLVSQYLAAENKELNTWAVQMLQIQPQERILEIGFGPGVAITEMVRITDSCEITGIDSSKIMVERARNLNKEAIRSGQVDLIYGSSDDLSGLAGNYDKVIAINNVMYWNNPSLTLQGVARLLKQGGLICLVIQREEHLLKGRRSGELAKYRRLLLEAGFEKVTVAGQKLCLERFWKRRKEFVAIVVYGYKPQGFQE